MILPRLRGLLVCLAVSTSCGDATPADPTSPAVPQEPASIEVAVGPTTTDGVVARRNLDAQIEGLRAAVARGFAGPEVRDALVGALLTRAQFFGTWADFDEALDVSAARLASPDAPGAAYRTRASALVAVHRFHEASAVLQSAPPDAEVAAALLSIEEATSGTSEKSLSARRESAIERRTFASLVAYATAQAGSGRFAEADATYVEAAEAYGDVSPFPIAWIAFSRGVMWSEIAGRPDLARPLYAEALARVPGYVTATVHLAELEADDGDVLRASARLASLANETLADPEPDAVLGALTGDDARIGRANAGYERMLARHPEAVWDHASEFFMAAGAAPQRALELATKNLELRTTERAYSLAIRAALGVGDQTEARRLADDVAEPIHTVSLRELVHGVSP